MTGAADHLPPVTPEESTAAGYLLVDDGSLEDVAYKLEISVLELVAIASRPHVQAHLDATRDLALKRAEIKAADAQVTAIRTLESIAANPNPPEKLSDHAERIALFHAIERRRAAIALLPRHMRPKRPRRPDPDDPPTHRPSRGLTLTPWAAIAPLSPAHRNGTARRPSLQRMTLARVIDLPRPPDTDAPDGGTCILLASDCGTGILPASGVGVSPAPHPSRLRKQPPDPNRAHQEADPPTHSHLARQEADPPANSHQPPSRSIAIEPIKPGFR
jgi:hypothetical protein